MDFGRTLMRAYPLVSGAGTLVNSKLFKTIFPPSDRTEWTRVEGGEILVALDDHVGRAIRYAGDLDPKVSWVIDRCVRPGDVTLDIAANCGLTALRMAARAGAAGRVHAFEPNPKLLEMLHRTLERNAEAPITLHPVALGDAPGELPLFAPAGNAGAASLVHVSRPDFARVGAVPVVTLSDYAEAQGIDRCDFIKIDVEGFEHNVLKGGLEFITTHRPRAILLEEFARPGAEGLPPSLALLETLGYAVFAAPVRLFSVRLEKARELGARRAHDYVAVCKERGAEMPTAPRVT